MSSYATQAQVESLLGTFAIPSEWTSGSAPTPLAQALTRVRSTIDAFCGTTFIPVTRQLLLDGNGTPNLLLNAVTSYPIATITSVWLRNDPTVAFTSADLLVENVDFCVHPSRRALTRMTSTYGRGFDTSIPPTWPKVLRSVQVLGTFGRTAVPPNITKAAVLLVREEIQPGYISDYGDAFYSETFPDGYGRQKQPRVSAAQAVLAANTTGHEITDRLLMPYQRLPLGFGAA